MTGIWPTLPIPGLSARNLIMPSWQFLGKENIRALIAYKQSLGFGRPTSGCSGSNTWKAKAVKAYEIRAG